MPRHTLPSGRCDGRVLERRTGFADAPRPLVVCIGGAEALGAAGLVLPVATGVLPWLTPPAAVGPAIDVLLAAGFHLRAGGRLSALETGLWAGIAAAVAIGRWERTRRPRRGPAVGPGCGPGPAGPRGHPQRHRPLEASGDQ